ncbi:hypothetical protein [Sphingobium nicotianae]|uniref:Uncharacterized protein n=1 Tax=Sphingobium nicotianae TaxID=2782607 RepID=A0A9X1DEY6_9SPHN|nr:hypothetical protein [Sphingobium nicotianae]MBT2188957.1 hypothetical protein [Sphingobium nicotianae]
MTPAFGPMGRACVDLEAGIEVTAKVTIAELGNDDFNQSGRSDWFDPGSAFPLPVDFLFYVHDSTRCA